jgi:peptide deformylase
MKIVKYPHPALRVKAAPVTTIDKDLQLHVGRMLELMYSHHGLGLAAPKVALPYQILVMNFAGDPNQRDQEHVALNPVIVEQKGSVEETEGCLSFPGLYQKVRRARTVKVQAYTLKGELYEMSASDLPSRVWQHEIDHLQGVLFIDKMTPVGKMASRKALEELEEEFLKAKEKGDLPPDMEPKF